MPTAALPDEQPGPTRDALPMLVSRQFRDTIWPRVIAVLSSLMLFGLACISPAIVQRGGDVLYGWQILQLGWLGPIVFQVAWWANPLLFLSMISLYKRRWR